MIGNQLSGIIARGAFLLVIPLLLQQCQFNYKRGNGNIETSELMVEDFNQLNVGGIYDVELIPGKKPLVIIETDENLIPYINVEVYNDVLNINNVQNLKSSYGIKIQIFYARIDRIQSSGASRIINREPLRTEDLTVGLSGSGSIDLELDVDQVEVRLSGAGLISLSGRAETMEGQLSGAGMLNALELETKNCKLNVSGIGGGEVWATETLEASITGIGGIKFKGNPNIIEREVTGLGKITRIEDQ